jgi:hypothetical protein
LHRLEVSEPTGADALGAGVGVVLRLLTAMTSSLQDKPVFVGFGFREVLMTFPDLSRL